MTAAAAFVAIWTLVALLYWQRHTPSGVAGWIVMLAATGAAAALLAGLELLVRRRWKG